MSVELSTKKKGSELDHLRRSQIAEGILSAQDQSAKQQEQIDHMANENEQLKKEISAVSGNHYDYVKADKLASLQADVDALERRYQFEKMRKNDLTKRYQLARIDLLHSRKMKGGVNVEKEQADAVQRQVEILESRLDQALGQFNDALSYNKELRDRIDVIREERRVFQRVHKRMEDDLKSKKRQMAEHIEKSNRDMDDRDAQVREVARLRAALEEQRQTYSDQLHDLDTAMLDIKTMREEQTEMQLELEAREYEFGERANDPTAPRGQEEMRSTTGTTSGAADDTVSVAGSDAGDESTNVLRVEKESATITNILHQIKEALMTEDLEELRAQYVHTGDLNFSLYKYINELSAKKEVLKDNTRDLQRLLSEEDDSETQHRTLIKRLEEELADTEGRLDEMTSATEQLRDSVQRTAGTAEEVYTHIGCPQMASSAVEGEERCTETNMKQFFGTIEERATQILIAFQHHHQAHSYSRCTTSSLRVNRDSEQLKDSAQAVEDEENAPTTVTTDSLAIERVSTTEDWEVEDGLAPMMPTAPQTAHSAVSARNLVRMMDLPSASLGGGAADRDSALHVDQDDDHIVSHEDLRKQMESRLAAMREREDRNQQRKKKDLCRESPHKAIAQQVKAAIVGGTS
ncbi:outer dynein arm docking complex putative (DC2) [Leptomonas pyrrhocoris]|uniref:Outer dynein arm docking complex putative (DC2) n=1 Tax=Leptomonas pyrrhocoris TaxID=157538 RepID=A0A0N0DZ51_LEPPY|nr:outer dynein arm docking complex putative (DC2) [Leptomonas pyrrhocoris]KPA84908.1 outer dynein arm docking complex putative (DC2) [Leptomonas pyrrhocoris]|eukprot:XP_015663347.1 outer dynein arm docking complex putative (DC2) [Leptomonas pyrrhocoris]